MHKGRYVRWDPFPGLSGRWVVEGLHDDFEGFRILLRGDILLKRPLRLTFDVPLLYQVADEGFRLTGADEDSELAFPHPFYTVERSSLLADFHRSSANVYEQWDIKHFAVYGTESCVDVLSVLPPKTEELPAGQPVA